MSGSTASARVRQLIREGAERALDPPEAWRDEVDDAVFAGPHGQRIHDDPELAATTRRVLLSTLSGWVTANVDAPGDPVAADGSDAPSTMARDLVRRGLDETVLDAYRLAQGVAWRHWMEIAFDLTDDPVELHELLDLTSRSMAAFVDASVDQVRAHMRTERDQLTRDVQAERRAVVALIVQGAPVSPATARSRLGYHLDRTHHACVVWSDAAEPDLRAIDRVADVLVQPSRATGTLIIPASTGTRWVWTTTAPRRDEVLREVRSAPDVRVALAGPARGLVGFRRAHLDALSTQRLLSQVGGDGQVASWDEVALASLASRDGESATRFVADVLGELADADPELRETLRAFITHGCSVTSAATATFTHRNTFLRRLKKAQALLPGPPERIVDVGVALELVHWDL